MWSGWQAVGGVLGRIARQTLRFVLPVGAVLVLAVLTVLIIWILPERLTQGTAGALTAADELTARNAVRTTLLQAVGGGILLSGLYFTAKTLRLNREGQITERYSRSVEQLGHPSVDVRLGGIFALERVARDSFADRTTVIEILTAFVREHTSSPDPSASGARVPLADPVSIDVQAALTVIGRRRVEETDEPLDLSYTGLHGANLSRGAWRRADFSNAELTWCEFKEADLERALFLFSTLKYCRFRRANCRKTVFSFSTVYRGAFLGADLSEADFTSADLSHSDFSGDGVRPATLREAGFDDATVEEVDLTGVDLREVKGLTQEQMATAKTDDL